MDLSKRIVAWRRFRGLSREQLASSVGVSAAAVYQWEGTGESKTQPRTANLAKIADAFDVSLAEFFGRVPKRFRRQPLAGGAS